MTNTIRLLVGVLIVASSWTLRAEETLPRSAPESQGIASLAVIDLVKALDEFDGMHSLMVVRHGNVIAEGWWEPYGAERNHVLYSLSKSFTSTAVGMAIADGKLSLDDRVVDLFPDETPPEATENLKSMRVRDLLTMSTGHQEEPSAAPDTVSATSFLAQAVPHRPGTHFKYNTAATFMQSAIVQKVTGETVLDYLQPRLFKPLGIENPVWDTNYQGISLGGYGLRLRTEDVAKFGQLYLQKGVWNDKRLIPAEWVEMATAKQVSNGSNPSSDWNQGYGFQFWRSRHNAYRGDGAFGQYCIVMPEQDVVVAITSGLPDMQAVLNVVWDKLLPACQTRPLQEDRKALEQLREKLAGLEVPPAEGKATSDAASRVLNEPYLFPANDQEVERITLSSPENGRDLTLTVVQDGKTLIYPASYRQWKQHRAAFGGGRLAQFPDEPAASTFAWESDEAVVIKVCAIETPFHKTFKLEFSDDLVTLDSEANVAFGPTKKKTLVGKRASTFEQQ